MLTATARGTRPGPRPRPTEAADRLSQHWTASASIKHPVAMEPPLEPAWERLLVIRRLWRHDLIRIWREVIAEIRELMDDLADESTAWLAARSLASGFLLHAGQASAHPGLGLLGAATASTLARTTLASLPHAPPKCCFFGGWQTTAGRVQNAPRHRLAVPACFVARDTALIPHEEKECIV